ncbi:MAG: DUF4390 domain-containing protein [Desulfovermiculus sp.]|nr:DUF4390 domain-containing protein [Desulfovermiculus sp.]
MLSIEYLLGLILGLTLVMTWTMSAGAQELVLDNLILDNVNERIQLRFGVQAEDVENLRTSLDNGGALRAECTISLRKQRSWWPDSMLLEKSRSYDLSVNPLTQSYKMINYSNEQTIKENNLKGLLEKGWAEIAVDLGPWKDLQSGATYIVELNLQFKRPDVPYWLKTTLFFWSWEVLSSQTYRMYFTY